MAKKITDHLDEEAVLNKILAEERVTIRVYNSSVDYISDIQIQKLLSAFQGDHKLIIERIKSRMRSLGINPKTNLGILESIDRAMLEISTLVGFGPSDSDIIEKIYNIEARNLQEIKKMKTDSLESVSQKFIKRIITINNNNLQQLKDLVNKF